MIINAVRILLVLSSMMISICLHSQLNLKIGYTGSYSSANNINYTIDKFNQDNPWLEIPFSSVHILNGIQVGIRQKVGASAIELYWENGSSSKSAIGTEPNSLDLFDKDISFSTNTIGLGLQYNFGAIGYGASIESRRLKSKTNIANTSNKKTLFVDDEWASRFYLSLNLPGSNSLQLSIQPFVQITWNDFDISSLDQELNPDNINPPERNLENFTSFGITIAFYNGRQ